VGLRSGGPKLKSTQVYPAKFGRTVAKHHLKAKAEISAIFTGHIYLFDISLLILYTCVFEFDEAKGPETFLVNVKAFEAQVYIYIRIHKLRW